MRYRLLVVLYLLLGHSANSQFAVQAEAGYWQFPVIDRIFRAYQLAHPWIDNTIQPLGLGIGAAAGWNQSIYAPRGLHALGMVHYRYQATSRNRASLPLVAGYHSASIELLIRSHPRCLLQDAQNTGPLGTRWYLQLGSGYNWNLPFATKYGETVSIRDEERYRSVSGQFYGVIGTGWHALTIGSFVLTLETNLSWFPRFTLENMATAVLGHNEPKLAESVRNSLMIQGCMRITRLKKSNNWWDRPRGGDKS